MLESQTPSPEIKKELRKRFNRLDKMAPLLGLKNVGYMRAFTTKQENQQKERNEKKSICRNGCPQRNDPNRVFNEQFKGNIERTTDKTQ
ncbi:hypothetical protein FFZ96_16285 [Leptospira borgpetersenii]|nr:hypothetical protein FFZ96_16285 [Leptospira borgpetersenii]